MDDDRAALLAAMYDPDEDEKTPGQRKPDAPDVGQKKSRRIVMGAVGFDVPTVEYVETLEKRVIWLERLAADQQKAVKRMEILLNAMRNVVQRQSHSVNDISKALDRKVDLGFDRRDL